MRCIICNHPSKYSFSKHFDRFDLGKVDYWTCTACGFTISETHKNMPAPRWEKLNRDCHQAYQGTDENPTDPRWLERLNAQAATIQLAYESGLIPSNLPWIDFACGDGKLSSLLKARSRLDLLKFDRYMQNAPEYLGTEDLLAGGFDFVITTSVFEHLTERSHFDAIEALVSEHGVLGMHTLVREKIPVAPDWFYLQAPHCSFHTNRSMEILFKQWGYQSSVYHVESRLWLWFKSNMSDFARNQNFIYKNGFVDYWKQ